MKVNGIKVKAVWGQISAVQADAYVVPEYPDHVSSTPMINDIIAGGAQYGFDVFKRHLSLGSLNMCSAVLSVANGGNSRYLIHSVVLGGPAEKLASNIEDAMSAVMTIALLSALASLALCQQRRPQLPFCRELTILIENIILKKLKLSLPQARKQSTK